MDRWMESMCRAGDQSSKIDRLRLACIASRLPIPSSFTKASWKGSDTVDGSLRLSSSIFIRHKGSHQSTRGVATHSLTSLLRLLVDDCCGAVATGGVSDALERPQPTLLYPQAEGRGNVWLTKLS